MAWLADIGNGKNPPEPKSAATPAKSKDAMPPFTFKPSVLGGVKPAEPPVPREKNSMQEALDFLAQESAKIQAEEAAEKAHQEQLAAEKAAAAREETLRLEAEQQAREKIARERAEQNRREQQEWEKQEQNKKKSRGMDL